MSAGEQLTIFRAVREVYAESDGAPVTNTELYEKVSEKIGVPMDEFTARSPVGSAGRPHALKTRTARWVQQTMRMRGQLEAVHGRRGTWQLTAEGKEQLHRNVGRFFQVAFSTDLGVAIFGDFEPALEHLRDEITLVVTSPPYPIARGRAYGTFPEREFVDFMCRSFEPVVAKLRRGGSLVVNVTNDCFLPGLPARSLYLERLVLALHDRLGLLLMDRIPWVNPCKPPSPVQWASKTRQQLNSGYEHLIWFTNDAEASLSNNNRVLAPHTAEHLALIAQGGEARARRNSDGAHSIRKGSFGKLTAGRIPRNVLTVASSCGSQRDYKAAARKLGLPVHGAPYPLRLVEFLVKFLSDEGDLVFDPFGGSLTTGLAAERHNRRWLCAERFLEYARGGAERFRNCSGFDMAPGFKQACGG